MKRRLAVAVVALLAAGCGTNPHGWTYLGNDPTGAAVNVKCVGTTLLVGKVVAARDPRCRTGTYDRAGTLGGYR